MGYMWCSWLGGLCWVVIGLCDAIGTMFVSAARLLSTSTAIPI